MGQYDDIIFLKHHKAQNRPHMSLHDRAAQFAPFAALNGYEEAVLETARLTDRKLELDENEIEILNERLLFLCRKENSEVQAIITYFVPDKRKSGGAYIDTIGSIKKLDTIEKTIILDDDTQISINDIYHIAINE